MIVGLDIGTSKVVAIVGEVNDLGEIEVIGIGSHPSLWIQPFRLHCQPQPKARHGAAPPASHPGAEGRT